MKKGLIMNLRLIIITLMSTVAIASASDKPLVYNVCTDAKTELDEAVNACLSQSFRVVDVHDVKSYSPPEPIAGELPRYANTGSREQVGGYVLVGYAVTKEGLVAKPCVIKTTDKRLDATALQAMKLWRFKAAKLNGQAVATTAAQEFNFEIPPSPPTEFVTQILEPTGGKIFRPKEWFYAEGHDNASYTWILSREEATKAPYTTGVRIQTFVGVKKETGKNGQEFVMDFLNQKKKEPIKVISECPTMSQGLFNRICLETEEGSFHIQYSLFWGADDLDVVTVMIAGTTKELWNTYSSTFSRMSTFELIDMTRFER